MENLLQEFENIDPSKSKILFSIKLLFTSIWLLAFIYIVNDIYYDFKYNTTIDSNTFEPFVVCILLLAIHYLILKIKKTGWLLLTFVIGLLWSFFAKIMFFYITSKWEIESFLNTFLCCYIFLASTALLTILYLKKARNLFKIGITLSTISVYINILIIFIVLSTFD